MKRGELLSDKRIEKGFSVSALAQELGVPAEEVERWEAGELPDSEHLLALSGLLEISVEDILRGGDNADGGQIGVADGAQGGGKEAEVNVAPQNSGAESADSHRFDFGGVRKERGASSAPEKAAPQESYYEKLHKKIRYSDNPSSPDYRIGGGEYNGYSKGERLFGYVVFALFTAVIVIMLAVQFTGWLARPRALTMENYRDFIEIDVVPTESFNPDDYVLRVTAKEYITDLRLTVRVKFGHFYDDDFFETVTVSAGVLRKDDTAEETIHISEIAFDRGFEVLSIEGDLA